MYRRRFLAAGALGLLPVAGCQSSSPGPMGIGEPVEASQAILEVERVDLLDEAVAVGPRGDGEDVHGGEGVLALPYISITNDSKQSEFDLPHPLDDIGVSYRGEKTRFPEDETDAIVIDERIEFPTYGRWYRDRNGTLGPGGVVMGFSAISKLPSGFAPEDAVVRITVGNLEYRWTFNHDEGVQS